MIGKKVKKNIAIHTLGLSFVGVLWAILNEDFYENSYSYTPSNFGGVRGYERHSWDRDLDSDGGLLLLGMFVVYLVLFWAVKTIWFDKDEDKKSDSPNQA